MANITRDNFDASRNVLKKILQKGVYWVDSDFNEEVDILNHVDRLNLSILAGQKDRQIDEGFKVVEGTGYSVDIKAGKGIFHISTDQAIILELSADVNKIPSASSSRTDYVYIDVHIQEIGSSSDPNVVNPEIGQETCVDERVSFTIEYSEGAGPGSPPANHIYIIIAEVHLDTTADITNNNIENYNTDIIRDLEFDDSGYNFIRNGSFEYWDSNAMYPLHWTCPSSTAVSIVSGRQSSKVVTGSWATDGYLGGAGIGNSMKHVVELWKVLKGHDITFMISAATEVGETGRLMLVNINDGVSSSYYYFYLSSDGNFTKNTATFSVSPNATKLEINIEGESIIGVGPKVYLDAAALYMGTNIDREWEPNYKDELENLNDATNDRIDDIVVPIYTDFTTATSGDAAAMPVKTVTGGGSPVIDSWIRVGFFYRAVFKKLRFEFQHKIQGTNIGDIILYAGAASASLLTLTGDGSTWYKAAIELDISSEGWNEGDYKEILVTVKSYNDTETVDVRYAHLTALLV